MIHSQTLLLILWLGFIFSAEAADKPSAEIRSLQEKRQQLARKVLDSQQRLFEVGNTEVFLVYVAFGELVEAELALAQTKEDRHKAFQSHLERVQQFRAKVKAGFDAGTRTSADLDQADLTVVKAQLGLREDEGR